ncbi:MAG: histidine kinase [Actinomycetota bacterium]
MTHSDRTLLARELHDGIAQDLVALGYAVDLVIGRASTPAETRVEIRKIRFHIDELINKVRNEIHELPANNGVDFVDNIRKISEISGATFTDDLAIELESEIAYQVIKIFTEIIRNIVEHANSTSISVSLELVDKEISLTIEDDGEGEIVKKNDRYGIQSVEQRVKLIAATLTRTRVGDETVTKLLFSQTT